MAIDAELVERFRADLAALCDLGEGRLGIAYSGGPDSLALLLLAHAAHPGQVEAATVDHGLRAESADEARLAAENCAQLGVPHATLAVEIAKGNLQSEARNARYAALSAWAEQRDIDYLLTAHHRDDQAETLLMRLNRGSGLSGLAGVRASTLVPDGEVGLLRPLLGWSRSELGQIVAASGFDAAHDPSNENDRFDRVRMRKALQQADWIEPAGLARSAQVLADMEDSVLGMAMEDCELAGRREGGGYAYGPFARSKAYRPAIWGEVIVLIYAELGCKISRSDAVRMARELAGGSSLNVAGIHASQSKVDGDAVWTFAPENPRRSA